MIHRLGGKVKSLRERDGLSQTELAHHLRVRSRGYISDIESGKKIPRPIRSSCLPTCSRSRRIISCATNSTLLRMKPNHDEHALLRA